MEWSVGLYHSNNYTVGMLIIANPVATLGRLLGEALAVITVTLLGQGRLIRPTVMG